MKTWVGRKRFPPVACLEPRGIFYYYSNDCDFVAHCFIHLIMRSLTSLKDRTIIWLGTGTTGRYRGTMVSILGPITGRHCSRHCLVKVWGGGTMSPPDLPGGALFRLTLQLNTVSAEEWNLRISEIRDKVMRLAREIVLNGTLLRNLDLWREREREREINIFDSTWG